MLWLKTSRDPTPILHGERVFLRSPQAGDYREWRDLRQASKNFLKPFEPRWTEADLAKQVYNARLKRGRDEAANGTDFSFFIFRSIHGQDELVGGITLSNVRRRAAQFVTLGYWMGEQFAGLGLMTEAVSISLPFVFGSLGLHRVQAACLPHNMASRRVLEKNGFREEGFAENYLQIDGKWADHVLFGLTKERFEAGRKR